MEVNSPMLSFTFREKFNIGNIQVPLTRDLVAIKTLYNKYQFNSATNDSMLIVYISLSQGGAGF